MKIFQKRKNCTRTWYLADYHMFRWWEGSIVLVFDATVQKIPYDGIVSVPDVLAG